MKYLFLAMLCLAFTGVHSRTNNSESLPMHIYELGLEFNFDDCKNSWVNFSNEYGTQVYCTATVLAKNINLYGGTDYFIYGEFTKEGREYFINFYVRGNRASLDFDGDASPQEATLEYFKEEIKTFFNNLPPDKKRLKYVARSDLKSLFPDAPLIDHGPAINAFRQLKFNINDCRWYDESGTSNRLTCYVDAVKLPLSIDISSRSIEETFKIGESKWVRMRFEYRNSKISLSLTSPWDKYVDPVVVRPQIDVFLNKIYQSKKDRAGVFTTKEISENDPNILSINGAAYLEKAKVIVNTELCPSTFDSHSYGVDNTAIFSCKISDIASSDNTIFAFRSESPWATVSYASISGRIDYWYPGSPIEFTIWAQTSKQQTYAQAAPIIEKYVQEVNLHNHVIEYIAIKK